MPSREQLSPVTADPIARFLTEGGAIVGGSAVLAGVATYIGASIVRDLIDPAVDPLKVADLAARLGGAFGLAYWLISAAGVQ